MPEIEVGSSVKPKTEWGFKWIVTHIYDNSDLINVTRFNGNERITHTVHACEIELADVD